MEHYTLNIKKKTDFFFLPVACKSLTYSAALHTDCHFSHHSLSPARLTHTGQFYRKQVKCPEKTPQTQGEHKNSMQLLPMAGYETRASRQSLTRHWQSSFLSTFYNITFVLLGKCFQATQQQQCCPPVVHRPLQSHHCPHHPQMKWEEGRA